MIFEICQAVRNLFTEGPRGFKKGFSPAEKKLKSEESTFADVEKIKSSTLQKNRHCGPYDLMWFGRSRKI